MENVSEDTFRDRVRMLKTRLERDEQPLACYGDAYGSNTVLEVLVQDAEVKMYAEKDIFHERFPKTKR